MEEPIIVWAARHGFYEMIAAMLKNDQVNPNMRDGDGATALMKSVQTGRKNIVKLLLDNGADVGLKDNSGNSALTLASGNEEIRQLLIHRNREYLKKYGINCFYHMTRINNLKSILEYGLLSHNEVKQRQLMVEDISDSSVQSMRSIKILNGKSLHDYVCLYFSPRNPMLYVRKNINDIIFLCINPDVLFMQNTYFSDGNAAAGITKFYNEIRSFDTLSWNIINEPYWNNYPDGKRIKCAEILVYQKIEVRDIIKICCLNQECKNQINQFFTEINKLPVEIHSNLYF